MSLNKCQGVKFICETHLSSIQCVCFWFIHNPIVELQSKIIWESLFGVDGKNNWGSFQGQFGDHFRVGIISGAVQSLHYLSDFLGRIFLHVQMDSIFAYGLRLHRKT